MGEEKKKSNEGKGLRREKGERDRVRNRSGECEGDGTREWRGTEGEGTDEWVNPICCLVTVGLP